MKTPGIQILDVRTAGEFQGGHFNNALQANWLDEKEFTETRGDVMSQKYLPGQPHMSKW